MTRKASRRQARPRRTGDAQAFGKGLRVSRWWDRNGFGTPLVRVLDALYGVAGPPVAQVLPAPALDAPPDDLVDDTPALFVSAWAIPPPDAK